MKTSWCVIEDHEDILLCHRRSMGRIGVILGSRWHTDLVSHIGLLGHPDVSWGTMEIFWCVSWKAYRDIMMSHGWIIGTSWWMCLVKGSLGDLNVSYGRIQHVLCQPHGDVLAHPTVAQSPLVVTGHVVSWYNWTRAVYSQVSEVWRYANCILTGSVDGPWAGSLLASHTFYNQLASCNI